jgi:chemotaxis protein methyltransferase CheR
MDIPPTSVPSLPLPPIDDELPESDVFDIELRLLLEAIYLRYQHDFRAYTASSLRRRVQQALQVMGIRHLSHLQSRVLREPHVFAQLMQYLTIQVSEMFRDPAYFQALREVVIPELRTHPSFKIWVAGCSHGEEVWSLAILLHEEGLLDRSLIYATDINPEALRSAENGVFPVERMPLYSRNYLVAGGRSTLSDYYTASYGHVAFDRALRRRIVFADHSLATDAVFSEMHFISCRNVLIYFNDSLQDRAVGLFRDSLVRRGYLGLGSRESLQFGAHEADFLRVENSNTDVRLYQRV